MKMFAFALSFAMFVSSTIHAQSITLPAEALPTSRPIDASSPIYRIGQISVVTFNAADMHSTLGGWQVGLRESNALISNDAGKLIAMKSASVLGQLVLMHVLHKTGHDKAAGWIGIGASALPAYAAIHNYRLNARAGK
jgi:hypothetical protein